MIKWKSNLFSSRVARRIFALFIICAVLPIAGLALVSFVYVKGQLYRQSEKRLKQECSSVGASMYDRLLSLRSDMAMVSSAYLHSPEDSGGDLLEKLPENISQRFRALAVIRDGGVKLPILRDIGSLPEFNLKEKMHMESGKPLLFLRPGSNFGPVASIAVLMEPAQPLREFMVGEISREYLWGSVLERPPNSELVVLDYKGEALSNTFPEHLSLQGPVIRKITHSHAGRFEWEYEDEEYFASYRTLYLKSNFLYPEWKIIISESKANVLEPVYNFNRAFPFVIAISLGVVFLLSVSQIRKNLSHIEILREATSKIARGSFGHRVDIRSGDEFETLGQDFNDMSKRLEEDQALLVQNEKMNVLGQMGAGIVHEANQPLSVISPLLQMAALHENSPEKRERLERVLGAVDRLQGILSKFKSFSHKSGVKAGPIYLQQIMDQIYGLFHHKLMMMEIKSSLGLDENLPPIFGDSEGMSQVFTNLFINAMDAMEEKEDGERILDIKAYKSNDEIIVEIKDTGCGMPEETQKRLFDPFFTTKPPGKGTGLGMAIVGSILSNHNARIHLESGVGKGTIFRIVFPVAPAGSKT